MTEIQGGRRGRIGRKLVLTFVSFVMVVVGGTGWALYDVTRRSLEREMSERLMTAALLVAGGLDGGTVRTLRPGDEAFLRAYVSLTARLQRARKMVGARRITVFDRQGRSLLDTAPDVPIGRGTPGCGSTGQRWRGSGRGRPRTRCCSRGRTGSSTSRATRRCTTGRRWWPGWGWRWARRSWRPSDRFSAGS
ncbi:MAG: hypothetical protein EXS64_20380 [Candidatus Latescibacteria bacterium]|nr:hypothetical protein [Candidatus Latescibacterota bacterium]